MTCENKDESKVTLESILYHFPGRTLEDLKIENLTGEINEYFSMFKSPNHYHLSRFKDNKPFSITRVSREDRRKLIEEEEKQKQDYASEESDEEPEKETKNAGNKIRIDLKGIKKGSGKNRSESKKRSSSKLPKNLVIID